MAVHAHTGGLHSGPFEDYVDVVLLSDGDHSSVFAARDRLTRRPVALKVLSVDGISASAREAFEREAAILSTLSTHPNIVTLYATISLSDGRLGLVLELCSGSLEEHRQCGGDNHDDTVLSVPEVVAIGIKIAGALETAHAGGVLHRDVRPANILITEYGEPALAGFAVARLRASAPAAAELFEFPGMHVAPELLLGAEPTPAVDVYGLAATLYTLITGEAPIPAFENEAVAASILRIVRDDVRPLVNPAVPLELSDLLLWALDKEPAARPPSMAWVAEELRRIEQHAGWPLTKPHVREPQTPVSVRQRRWFHRTPRRHGN